MEYKEKLRGPDYIYWDLQRKATLRTAQKKKKKKGSQKHHEISVFKGFACLQLKSWFVLWKHSDLNSMGKIANRWVVHELL